jgi:outer membrane protein assembly factor BamB
VWRFVTGGRVTAKPAADHRGVLYVASEDRYLYSLTSDGCERWRAPLGSRPTASPVVAYDGTILVGTAAGRLLAFAPSGRERWSFRTREGACLTPALGRDGSIFLPASRGSVYCLNYTGRERWRFRAGVEISSPPAIGPDGTAYFGMSDRRLMALSPDGEKRWEIALPGQVTGLAIGPGGCLYVGASGIHRVSPAGSLEWSFAIPARTAGPVLTEAGAVVAGAWNGVLYAVSQEGVELWELQLPEPIGQAPAAAGELLYVATASPRFFAVGTDGSLRWSFAAKQPVGCPAVGRDGGLYLGAEDWIFYSLGKFSPQSAPVGWPLFLHDFQNTGRAGALADLDNSAALILKTLAASESPELKLMALEDISAYLHGQRYLGLHVQTLEEILGFLTSEGVTIRQLERGAPVEAFPRVRAASCEVLAELGSEGARSELLSVLKNDGEVAVRIAALQALGRLALDPDGELARLLMSLAPRGGDEALLLPGVDALGRIALAPNGAVHPDCFLALARFRLPEYPSAVRERAAGLFTEISRQRR